MNVLHVSPYCAPAWAYGNVPHAVAALARAQVGLGYDVTVLTTDALAPHERLPVGETVVEGVRVIRVRNASGAARTWLNLSTPIGMRRRARAAFHAQTIDIVHLHELRTIENLRVTDVAPPGAGLIVSPHGTIASVDRRWGVRRAWDATVGAGVLERVDAFVAPSEVEAQEIRTWLAQHPRNAIHAQVTVLADGIDLPSVATPPEREAARRQFGLHDGPVVMFLGSLSKDKGIALLVGAFARALRDLPKAQLLLAGPDRGALAGVRAQIARLGLGEAVCIPGYLSPARSRAALAAADVFALPSGGPGITQSALEALASGVPLLLGPGCNLPGAAEAGRVVALDEGAWAEAFGEWLTDSEARSLARMRAPAVAAGYGWPAVAKALDVVYRTTLHKEP